LKLLKEDSHHIAGNSSVSGGSANTCIHHRNNVLYSTAHHCHTLTSILTHHYQSIKAYIKLHYAYQHPTQIMKANFVDFLGYTLVQRSKPASLKKGHKTLK